jgi:hypothetical protein
MARMLTPIPDVLLPEYEVRRGVLASSDEQARLIEALLTLATSKAC